jgi:hypothetical protein
MQKILSFIVGLIVSSFLSTTFAQDNFWNEKGDVLQYYQNIKSSDTNFVYEINDINNIVKVKIDGEDNLLITHFFSFDSDNEIYNESICDSLIIELNCIDCIDKHINKLINSKQRRWQEYSDTLYISRTNVATLKQKKKAKVFSVPFMHIHSDRTTTRVTIYRENLTKKQWKMMLKSSY